MQNGSLLLRKWVFVMDCTRKKGQIFGAGLQFCACGPQRRLAPYGGPKAPTQSNVKRGRGRGTREQTKTKHVL